MRRDIPACNIRRFAVWATACGSFAYTTQGAIPNVFAATYCVASDNIALQSFCMQEFPRHSQEAIMAYARSYQHEVWKHRELCWDDTPGDSVEDDYPFDEEPEEAHSSLVPQDAWLGDR